jgi:hypothetical protein
MSVKLSGPVVTAISTVLALATGSAPRAELPATIASPAVKPPAARAVRLAPSILPTVIALAVKRTSLSRPLVLPPVNCELASTIAPLAAAIVRASVLFGAVRSALATTVRRPVPCATSPVVAVRVTLPLAAWVRAAASPSVTPVPPVTA